jgi:hypothetical protein
MAAPDGTLSLRWSAVDGAAAYEIRLQDLKRKRSRSYAAKTTSFGLRGLLPGRYELRLRSLDSRPLAGPYGEPRLLEVPATSDIPPPALDDMQVH